MTLEKYRCDIVHEAISRKLHPRREKINGKIVFIRPLQWNFDSPELPKSSILLIRFEIGTHVWP